MLGHLLSKPGKQASQPSDHQIEDLMDKAFEAKADEADSLASSFADKPLPAMGSMSRDQVSQMVVSDLYGMCGARKEINASAQALARRHEYKSRKSGSMTVFGESSGSIVW